MGYYVNPKDKTKEEWLLENGAALSGPPVWGQLPEEAVAVCLVDNGPFTAAGICVNEMEYQCFVSEEDDRQKIWWIVRREDLIEAGFVTEDNFK